jgi:tagatose-6-phosphate ketose/aldose isomerase
MLEINTQNRLLEKDCFTEAEILGQPELWLKLWDNYQSVKQALHNYLYSFLDDKNVRIILTGAGTSAFIGDVLLGLFSKSFQNPINAVATTDIITHPELYFSKSNKYLLISFARSGNSPESSQVILLSEQLSKQVYHLIITCNNKSELTRTVSDKNHFTFLMPPEADDKGLAMTGSFTAMLLAGLLITRINKFEGLDEQFNILHKYGNKILIEYLDAIKKAAALDFKRAVFLGSGMFKGIARESQLKLQELTDGKIICKYDSFMGFRHGPKAVIDEDTLVVYLFSNNEHVNLYEIDLVNAIVSGRRNLFSIGVMEKEIKIPGIDLQIVLSENGKKIQEDFLTIVSVLPAQLLGLYKSLNLGINPDSPSSSGMIHRVVQGVKVYPYSKQKE